MSLHGGLDNTLSCALAGVCVTAVTAAMLVIFTVTAALQSGQLLSRALLNRLRSIYHTKVTQLCICHTARSLRSAAPTA